MPAEQWRSGEEAERDGAAGRLGTPQGVVDRPSVMRRPAAGRQRSQERAQP
jgi:hypothetical protein